MGTPRRRGASRQSTQPLGDRRAFGACIALGLIAFAAALAVLFIWWRDLQDTPMQPGPLLRPVAAYNVPDKESSPASAVRSRFVEISSEAIGRLMAALPGASSDSEPLVLALFPDVRIEATLTDRSVSEQEKEARVATLTGGVDGVRYASSVLVIQRDRLTASFNVSGARYRIVPVEPPLHRIDEVKSLMNGDRIILE